MSDPRSDDDAELIPVDDRERLLIDAVVTLARNLRDERDRLAERLRQIEHELQTLTLRLDARRPDPTDPPPAESR